MPYASQQDLIDRYSEQELLERTDVEGTGAINASVVAAALADADAMVDLHLRIRYRVPLTLPAPKEIVEVACQLARFKLWKDMASDTVTDGRDQAIKTLEKIAAGKVALDIEEPVKESRGILYSADAPVFSAETLRDFTG